MAATKQNVFVVLHPFGSYTKGQIVMDPAEMASIKQGGQMAFVISTQIPAPPSSSPAAKREA